MSETPKMEKLQTFLYILMRDHMTPGNVELILRDHVDKVSAENRPIFSAGHLADYAMEMAERIARDSR